jgi:hypothetical protein
MSTFGYNPNTTVSGTYADVAVKFIVDRGVALDKIVLGKPISKEDLAGAE